MRKKFLLSDSAHEISRKTLKSKLRLPLLAIALLATLGLGGQMFILWQKDTLWGHLPLFFFLSAWLSILLLFWKKHTRHPKGLRWVGLATLSGILLSIGFPPLPFTPILFIAWVPLLIVEHEISEEKAKQNDSQPKVPSLLRYGYMTFVLWNILVTWWVGNTAFVAGIVAIWLNAFFMCGPILLFHWTKRVLPNLGYAAFIVYWICFELLHLHWEISWSWLNLGNAFAALPSWVQWYEYTGTFGGTLWILVLNVLIFKLLQRSNFSYSPKKIWQEHIGGVIKIAGLILIPLALSLVMFFQHDEKGRDVEIVVVQPNFEPHYEKFTIPRSEQAERFARLSSEALTENTEYLVFPETSFRAGEDRTISQNVYVRQFRRLISAFPKLKLVTGVTSYHIFQPGEPLSRAAREEVRKSETFNWEAYNAAIQIENGVDSIQFYVKSKLVPGPEITPYPKLFFFLKPIIDKLDGSLEGHGTQPEREAFSSSSGRVAPVICYESIFGEYHTGYIKAGAEAIFIVTNDGWWDNTAGHKQHLAFASLRAIETRRAVARSANTGISCFLNQRGDILQPTEYGVEATVRGTIKFNDEITFYVRYGDLIARVALFIAAIIFLNTIAKGLLKRSEQA